MATVNFCPQRKQSRGALRSVVNYVLREEKLRIKDQKFVSGQHCCPSTTFTEFITTKQSWKKTDGVQFYHFVQSFHPEENLTAAQANEIGLELAKQFEGYEVLVATHVDTNHIHNHLVVNSVSFQTGKKLHQNRATLMEHRKQSDEICKKHGLTVLPPTPLKKKSKRMTPKEYQAALRGNSWKLELIAAIEDALLYSTDKETFMQNMEYEGYKVKWTDNRKSITYTCPNGMKCRDNKLHDDTYLKDNMEYLFAFRKKHGFMSGTEEPESMWLTQAESMNPNAEPLSDEEFERRCVQREKQLELIEENGYQQSQDFELSY